MVLFILKIIGIVLLSILGIVLLLLLSVLFVPKIKRRRGEKMSKKNRRKN